MFEFFTSADTHPLPGINHLLGHGPLKNTYLILRHGESEANVEGVACNTVALEEKRPYKLTDLGKQQAASACIDWERRGVLKDQLVVVTSPLTRAKETAEIFCRGVNYQGDLIVDDRLIERHAGKIEGKSYTNLKTFDWCDDLLYPNNGYYDMESPVMVTQRTTALIKELEGKYTNRVIVLVGHECALNQLRNAFTGRPVGTFESIPNGALLELTLCPKVAQGVLYEYKLDLPGSQLEDDAFNQLFTFC